MPLINERALLISNENVGPRIFLMKLHAPALASALKPGQFVHMRVPGMEGHILRRPFSIYAWDESEGTIDILYQVVGFGSHRMTKLQPEKLSEEDPIELLGPVGQTWLSTDAMTDAAPHKALLVGGGVGAPPLFMLAKQLLQAGVSVDVVLGAQTKNALVCKDRFGSLLGTEPLCATDDGTYGRAGFCTSLVEEALQAAAADKAPYDYVATCGPTPLMKIVASMAAEAGVPCEVSMEKRMACGVGACLSCVVETTEGKRRACVDGPVFDARKVVW